MTTPPPLTYLMFVYNEESRIADILRHAVQWADEVLVLDKQSTDRTRAICAEYGARVVEIPFAPQGHDDMVSACRLARHDWIWLGTASEIPTRKVVDEARRILGAKPSLDLVYVPRKIYSFGMFTADSPWGVRHYPFLINRRQVTITNTIHNNFRPHDKSNTVKIEYADDCCVHHYTHTTAKSYMAAMTQYFEAEVERPDVPALTKDAVARAEGRPELQTLAGTDAFGFECGWRLYWLGTALYGWEKMRGVDAPQIYREQRAALLQRDWPTAGAPARRDSGPPAPSLAPPEVMLVQPGAEFGSDQDVLVALKGRPIAGMVRTLYQIGAHRFQEKRLLFEIFPRLERVVLFEPLPELFAALREQEKSDPRVTVLPYAVFDRDGETVFNVANNDGASSSLLPFGKHKHLFPTVETTRQITVQTRSLETAIREHQLPQPDLLFLDVQGAEYQILATLTPAMRGRLRVIYTEASTEEIYAGSKTLAALKDLLASDFNFAGYCPMKEKIQSHGNALFVNRNQAWLLVPAEAPVATTEVTVGPVGNKPWTKFLRAILPRKLRRSIRKRLASISQALAN
jgi:FkbM family methyltransferase